MEQVNEIISRIYTEILLLQAPLNVPPLERLVSPHEEGLIKARIEGLKLAMLIADTVARGS